MQENDGGPVQSVARGGYARTCCIKRRSASLLQRFTIHQGMGSPGRGTPAPATACAWALAGPGAAAGDTAATAPAAATAQRPQVRRQKGPATTSVVLHSAREQAKVGVGGLSTHAAAGGQGSGAGMREHLKQAGGDQRNVREQRAQTMGGQKQGAQSK